MGNFGDTWKSPFFVLWPLGQKWRFSSFTKIPHVGTLNLCQKMPDKMQMDSGQYDHSILRKRPKWPKMANFHHILDVFSGLNDQIDLNPFASCQTSSGTSLEYPHGVFWWYLKIAIFALEAICWVSFRVQKLVFRKTLFSKVDSHIKSDLKTL